MAGEDEWFFASWIYGKPYRAEKSEFWQWISNELGSTDAPWIYARDLNEIIFDKEKLGGSQHP